MGSSSSSLSNFETFKISIWWLGQHKYLKEEKAGVITWTEWLSADEFMAAIQTSFENQQKPHLRIVYDIYPEEGKKRIDYNISLARSKCFYGGFRWWFLCPVIACGKRVGVLYKAKNGAYFCCRHCQRLVYASKNLSKKFRGPHILKGFELDQKISKLSEKITKTHYRGKPTKKQIKLDNLFEQLSRIGF